ncbi:MAG: efflux transporter periplasmic adaptor subunit, partial [Pseudomonadota bacterium]
EGPTLSGQIVVPRSAVNEGRVLVADDENRLRRRDVEVRAIQGDEALITGGLSAGERIVLSDLSPAIEGMLLEPVEMSGDDAAIDQSAEQ